MRFLLELGWFVALDSAAARLDDIEPESATTPPDVVGLDTAAPPPDVDELPPEDSILASLAQPPIMRTKKVIKIVFLSMLAPP